MYNSIQRSDLRQQNSLKKKEISTSCDEKKDNQLNYTGWRREGNGTETGQLTSCPLQIERSTGGWNEHIIEEVVRSL